jgi:hypothetical protein
MATSFLHLDVGEQLISSVLPSEYSIGMNLFNSLAIWFEKYAGLKTDTTIRWDSRRLLIISTRCVREEIRTVYASFADRERSQLRKSCSTFRNSIRTTFCSFG